MEQYIKAFYREKRIFLTGHTGFKGTWMSIILELLGAKVCGYSLPVNKGSFYQKAAPQIALHVEGDIADSKKVLQAVEKFQPEIIFHLASHSSLDGSMKIPDFILRTNLMGVVNVLEAARKTDSVKTVIVVTSDKCYDNKETDTHYQESAPLGAKDPYSTSKVCQELLTKCYRETFFQNDVKRVAIASARASNVIGGGDYNISRLIPYLLESYLLGKVPQIRNPKAVRPWQDVLDVLEGYLLLGEKLYTSLLEEKNIDGPYNFGPDEDGFVTVEDITKLIGEQFKLYGKEVADNLYTIQGKDRIKKETKILKLDSTKAHKVLEWKSRMKLQKTVRWTTNFVIWEKEGKPTGDLCRKQVTEYLKL